MLPNDFSPPTTPSLAQQQDALRKGLGRTMQWALRGDLADEPLLEACLQDQRFDLEVAEPRGKWLWQLIQAKAAADRYRAAILHDLQTLPDERSALQLCQLARHFAAARDEAFRTRLYEIVEQKPIKDAPWLGEEEIVALDGAAGFQFAARLRGLRLLSREWEWDDDRLIECAAERCGQIQIEQLLCDSADAALSRFLNGWRGECQRQADRPAVASRSEGIRANTASEIIFAAESDDARFGFFRTWGMHAAPTELEIVLQQLWATTSADSLANLLSVFANRALPQFDARLIEFCQHESKNVRWRALVRYLRTSTRSFVASLCSNWRTT